VNRDELHARIRRLIFASTALSEAFTRGEFRSIFKGRGVDFEALREYDEGDDARLIDWNVSVRLAKPFIRLYREDRSLTLFLLIDVSASMEAGSGELSKRDMAVLASSLLAYAAQLRGMPVGALIFSGEPLRYFEPRRGKAHALALIEAAVAADSRTAAQGLVSRRAAAAGRGSARSSVEAPAAGSDLPGAFDTAGRILKRRSLVIASSDFFAAGYMPSLARLARRHDVVALRLRDDLDGKLPGAGAFTLHDAEGGERLWMPLRSRRLRAAWADFHEAEDRRFEEACVAARVPRLELDTACDPALALLEFFGRRRRG
jgi:uncharacterized protein (DUF58 family)